MASNQTIKKIISIIKTELNTIYPIHEVNGFVKILFEYLYNYSSTDLLMNQDKEVSLDELRKIYELLDGLKKQEPIQYILGETEFYNLKFKVGAAVLIPRQETEELVDLIIKENLLTKPKILDIGTGSGCIAVSLAKNIIDSQVHAMDISKEALKLASQNANLNKVEVSFIHKDILNKESDFTEKFDVIVSNPPYVTDSEKQLMEANVLDHEPHLALFVSDSDPLIFYRTITEFAKKQLNKNGKLYFEINEAFGKETANFLVKNGFSNVKIIQDLNGKDRIVAGEII